jgi:hypothetical protein
MLPVPGIVLFCAAGGSSMTSAGETSSRGFLLPYIQIFRIPRAWRFSVAGIVGRMPMAMYGLGTVLLISAGTGRYGGGRQRVGGGAHSAEPSARRRSPGSSTAAASARC